MYKIYRRPHPVCGRCFYETTRAAFMCLFILYMSISVCAHVHIQVHSLMRALTLLRARIHARMRMHMHTTHTSARAQTRMHPGTRGPDHARTHAPAHEHACMRTHTRKHTYTCPHAHAPALRKCTQAHACMRPHNVHTHAAHACMRLHNVHACIRTRTREHTCTCARTRANTCPHILLCATDGAILLSCELCLGRPHLSLAVWPCLYCTHMATPPTATLVVGQATATSNWDKHDLSQWDKQVGTGCACPSCTSTNCSSGTSIWEQVVFVPVGQAGFLYQTCPIGTRRGQKRPLLVPWHKSYTHDGGLSLCHGTSSIPRWSLYLFHLCQLVQQSGSARPCKISIPFLI